MALLRIYCLSVLLALILFSSADFVRNYNSAPDLSAFGFDQDYEFEPHAQDDEEPVAEGNNKGRNGLVPPPFFSDDAGMFGDMMPKFGGARGPYFNPQKAVIPPGLAKQQPSVENDKPVSLDDFVMRMPGLNNPSLNILQDALDDAKVQQPAPACPADETQCPLPNCQCSQKMPPNKKLAADMPQIVMLTFDDAVNVQNMKYYNELSELTNSNDCGIGMTFYVKHEDTNYAHVHALYTKGHEIALHSITHVDNHTYWSRISEDDWKKEFADQRIIMETHAIVPSSHIVGVRVPFLQIGGDVQFRMMKNNAFKFDSSMPSRVHRIPPLYPYTLDFKSIQDCQIPPCPSESHKGIWEVPMVTHVGSDNIHCAMVDACNVKKSNETFHFLLNNFNRHYLFNRAPYGLFTHSSWFDRYSGDDGTFAGYKRFVEHILTLPHVYVVTVSDGLAYLQNPVNLTDISSFPPWKCKTRTPDCTPQTCHYDTAPPVGQEKNLVTCADNCPAVYPWLGNPNGKDD